MWANGAFTTHSTPRQHIVGSFLQPLAELWKIVAPVIVSDQTTGGLIIQFSSPTTWFPSGTRLVLITVGVSIVVSLLGINTLRNWLRKPPSFESIKLTRLKTGGKVVTAAISADGQNLAYVTTEAGKQTLCIKQLTTATSIVEIIPAMEADYLGLTFSPDGNIIYFVRSTPSEANTVHRMLAWGRSSMPVTRNVDGAVALSRDGKRIAYLRSYPDQNETALIVAQADGSGERKLAVLKGRSDAFVPGVGPAWSPDGKTIALAATHDDANGADQKLLAVNVADGMVNPIGTARLQQVGSLAWLVGGSALVTTGKEKLSDSSQIWQIAYPSGEMRRLTNDSSDYRHLTLTRDSRQIVAVQSSHGSESRDVVVLSGTK